MNEMKLIFAQGLREMLAENDCSLVYLNDVTHRTILRKH